MSSGNVIVEVSKKNNIKTVSLDSTSHIYGWQVIQAIQDGGENNTASENIILRTRNGVRLLPTKKLESVIKKKTKRNRWYLYAQIMGEGGVNENGEQGDNVKRSFGRTGSDSEYHHNNISKDQPEAPKEIHKGESNQEFLPTENKKRKVQCNEAGQSSKHTFIKGSTCGQTSSKQSTRSTDSPEHEILTDSPAKPQEEDKRCIECGSTGKRQSTLMLGFKRNHGWIGEDQLPSNSKVNLTLSQRGCSACPSNVQKKSRSSNNERRKKEPRKNETPGVAPCIDTRTKTDTFFSSEVKKGSEKCIALESGPSSTKESLRTSSDESVEFKSRYFPSKDDEDSACSSNNAVKIKRKSAKSIKANTSAQPIGYCSSTQINKEISGSSLVESTGNSRGCSSSKVNKSRKTSVEVAFNIHSLHSKNMDQWISTSDVADARKSASDVADGRISTSDVADVRKSSISDVADGRISTSDVADVRKSASDVADGRISTSDVADDRISTSDVADCRIKSKHATKITKDGKVSVDINRHSKIAKKEGKKSTRKSEDQKAKHQIVSTQELGDQGKSTTKCVEIVAKQFEHPSSENGIQQKFHSINLQTLQRDPLDLVENFVENGSVDGLYESKEVNDSDSKVFNNGEQSFIDDLHDDEINCIHTEDCDSEEPDRGTQSSSYITDDAVVINIGRNELRRSDLDTLHEGEWLNDCVINAYFILLGDVSPLNVFSHSSFFFWSLYKRGYEGVQRWTKNVDLFAQDIIFIPVHNKSHWTLVAVHVKEGIIEYYNSSTFHDGYPNSMKYIQHYLKDEAVHRGKAEFSNFNWEMFILDQIPRQQNSDDCGLFICQYAKKICLEQKIKFNAERTNSLRQQMLHELLHEEIEKDEPKDGMS